MDKVCGNCIHFDLCESEFSVSFANPDDQACDDFIEDGGYSDEIYRQSELIGNPIHRDYLSTDIKFNKDERIRKAIIGYIDHGQHYGVSNKDMIAWLERQGEQIHANSAQICKIENYREEGWYSSGDDEYICGISFDEPIKLPVEFYYKKKEVNNEEQERH